MLSWTDADYAAGFPVLRRTIAGMPNSALIEEYKAGMRACSDPYFGHNARILQREIAGELFHRGISAVPSIFGAIPISEEW